MDSMAWYWCGRCHRWHSYERENGPHWGLVPIEEQWPNSKNFDGDSDQLLRFQAGYKIRHDDQVAAQRDFEERIDVELARER